ncbi:hypothetical protein RGQ13_12785 [Thalassotalea psychrophila]|uniref:DUF6841 domain-containing protein n=1 Tax=Thalassotalea psychrophila TaxID=3065647 RepID=A0ABY9TTD8_9GAMM|nr:hypothetical protein RGQ13_12785 [Colwelliaceae bacterium SQ149]
MKNSEISQFIHEYCRAFRPGNINEIIKYFHYPTTMLVNGMNLHVASSVELEPLLSSGLSDMKSKGFSYSKIQDLYIHSLSEKIAIVSASYIRFKSDDTALEEIAATYTIFNDSELGCGIVTIIAHELDKVIGK